MKLYFSPGACALGPQIILREAGLNFDLVKVDLKTKQFEGGNYFEVNPKGYVPALKLPDESLLTEGSIILQWIADQVPEKNLIPRLGTRERYTAMEWLNYISSELHKGYSPLFYAHVHNEEALKWNHEKVAKRLSLLDKHLADNDYILGSEFSVVDAYAYNILRWSNITKVDLTPFTNLQSFMARMNERPTVKAAVAAEGIRL